MSEPTPRTDGLPAGMELGTVYLFPFRGGSGTLYEFVSAVSYHELERTLAEYERGIRAGAVETQLLRDTLAAQRTALLAMAERIRREGMQGVANEIEEIIK